VIKKENKHKYRAKKKVPGTQTRLESAVMLLLLSPPLLLVLMVVELDDSELRILRWWWLKKEILISLNCVKFNKVT